jgi:hypothetical protein
VVVAGTSLPVVAVVAIRREAVEEVTRPAAVADIPPVAIARQQDVVNNVLATRVDVNAVQLKK